MYELGKYIVQANQKENSKQNEVERDLQVQNLKNIIKFNSRALQGKENLAEAADASSADGAELLLRQLSQWSWLSQVIRWLALLFWSLLVH